MTPQQQKNMKDIMSRGLGPPGGGPKGAGQGKHNVGANNQPPAQPSGN